MQATDNRQASERWAGALAPRLVHWVRGANRQVASSPAPSKLPANLACPNLSSVGTTALLATCAAYLMLTSPVMGQKLPAQHLELPETFRASGIMTSVGAAAASDQQVEVSVAGPEQYRVSTSDLGGSVTAQIGQCDAFVYQFRRQPNMSYDLVDVALEDSDFLVSRNNPGIMLGLLVVQKSVDSDSARVPQLFSKFSYFNQEAFRDLIFTNIDHGGNSLQEWRVYCRVKGLAEAAPALLLGSLSLDAGGKTNVAALATLTLYDPFWANVESKRIFRKHSLELGRFENLDRSAFECAPLQSKTIHATDRRNPSAVKQFDVRPGEWRSKVIGTMRRNQLKRITIVLTVIILTGVAVYFARRALAKP